MFLITYLHLSHRLYKYKITFQSYALIMNNTTAVLKHNMYHKYTTKDFATEKTSFFTTNIYIFSTGDMITIHNVVKYYIVFT